GWKENVYAGHLFVFVSRRRDRVKVLTWDNGGFIVFYKRLEQGRFRLPQFHEGALGAPLDATQLALLLGGIHLSHLPRPKKWAPEETDGARQAPGNLISTGRWHPARRVKLTTASGGRERRRSRRKSSASGRKSPASSGK